MILNNEILFSTGKTGNSNGNSQILIELKEYLGHDKRNSNRCVKWKVSINTNFVRANAQTIIDICLILFNENFN